MAPFLSFAPDLVKLQFLIEPRHRSVQQQRLRTAGVSQSASSQRLIPRTTEARPWLRVRSARQCDARSRWVPASRDMIWIDSKPQAGREMRDVHPLLVLSPRQFNGRTGIVVGLPMTSASYNDTNPFAMRFSGPKGVVSYILAHQPNHSTGEHVEQSQFQQTNSLLPKMFQYTLMQIPEIR